MLRIMEEERDYYKTEYETLRKKKGGKSPTNKEKVTASIDLMVMVNFVGHTAIDFQLFSISLEKDLV